MALGSGTAPLSAGSEPAVLLLNEPRVKLDWRTGIAPVPPGWKPSVLLLNTITRWSTHVDLHDGPPLIRRGCCCYTISGQEWHAQEDLNPQPSGSPPDTLSS